MTPEDKKKIVAYLSGPRPYAEGVRLYDRYGHNRMFKRRFALEETDFTRSMLVEELRKLAGLTEAEMTRLPRLARDSGAPRHGDAVSPLPAPAPANANEEAPEPVRKMLRFRERFPFLKDPSCPDVFKVLVSDLFAAYDRYREAHARLQEIPDGETASAAREAEAVVESYLANQEIWAELEHYRATGEVLGRSELFRKASRAEDLAAMSDLDLARKLSSARANQSKQRKALKTAEETGRDTAGPAEALARWTDLRTRLEEEVERRKKK